MYVHRDDEGMMKMEKKTLKHEVCIVFELHEFLSSLKAGKKSKRWQNRDTNVRFTNSRAKQSAAGEASYLNRITSPLFQLETDTSMEVAFLEKSNS